MSASQMHYLYNVHCAKMIRQHLSPLTYYRFREILTGLGF
jgi:hypothetical protein